ncbi:toprim domain-containing protein [Heliorestis convoluta]|uniref:DNA primase n=1 Tax=Heliorestis convoluta TaxID=356322 RepID=A0A5Q2N221_9FIRM|nr:toprim domain-containing protein [Heliorestis convoluta]QGG47666.1 DNA primase [Heliorestis convoluta]
MLLQGQHLDIDIEAELQQYDWRKPSWKSGKFLACSPFRQERTPSFAVRLDNGIWIDSGSSDEEWRKGNFAKLLSWLRNETYEETVDYLIQNYGYGNFEDIEALRLTIDLPQEVAKKEKYLASEILKSYLYRHPYLEEVRGISETWQRRFKIGYDKKTKAITIPWFERDGQLVNVKYRSVKDKRFWYFRGGQPVKDHLYGLHCIYQEEQKSAFIVESEIDVLTLCQAGFAAIALGGANLSRRQKELLIQSPVEELILATDNDKAGERIAQTIVNQLNGYKKIKKIRLPDEVKDVNDLSQDRLLKIITESVEVSYFFTQSRE